MASIKLRICPNGLLYAETKGVKGKKCTDYEELIEALTEAKILEKELTEEYYQNNYEEIILEERV